MNSSDATSPWRARLNTPLLRLLLLGALLLMLMIPASMIAGVVTEREARRDEAVADIIGKWGGAQTLVGPVLRVPFVTRTRYTNSEGKIIENLEEDAAYFLPRSLSVKATAATELRRRGIFEVPVYAARLQLQGEFAPPDFSAWNVRPQDVDWKRAELMLGLSEPRALHADASLVWNGQPLRFKPSSGQSGSWNPAGIHAALGAELEQVLNPDGAVFSLGFAVNGADALYFSPTAEETHASLGADWPHPSFQGGWLPAGREISDQAFSAHWSVSYLGRDYPQRWRDSAPATEAIGKAYFGARFSTPVDHYSMAERITKYAVMTLVFTFAVIWLTEILSGARAHLIQYAFTGAALCLFGLLQLSFAEHFGFNWAFAVAAAAVVLMVTLYSRSMLRSARRALVVGGVLSGLYLYLYMILQAEDYALLGGSLALFAGLATAMYLTRKIDWAAPASAPLTSQQP